MSAVRLANNTLELVLNRNGDESVLPHVHIMLAFFSTLACDTDTVTLISGSPWTRLATFLNSLIESRNLRTLEEGADGWSIRAGVFPSAEISYQNESPLPEDYLIRGLIWAGNYFPKQWFQDKEEHSVELTSTTCLRSRRILRLGYCLSTVRFNTFHT